MGELQTIKTLNPQPFKCMVATIGNLPTSFVDSMSYYECIAWLVQYLEKTVIPAINNNAQAVAELQELYIELKKYVDEYFDNLDVQEEINNKLDQMADDGTLADIIADYVQLRAILSYNTVAEMAAAENLYDGSFAETYGYYVKGDAGNAKYKVRTITNDDVVDGRTIIALADDNLVAEYIPQGTSVYVKQFGAKGDGLTDDTESLQAAVDYCTDHGFNCVVNTTQAFYKTTMPIILNVNNDISSQYWTTSATKIVGEHHGNCRIVKIGDGVYTNINATINNVNATLIAYADTDEGTGIVIDEISLENYTNTSFDRTNGSLGLWTNVSRSTYSNLNIRAYSGIRAKSFSSKFENIVIFALEQALYSDNATSNLYRFIYTATCNNPYKIEASYSTLLNVCCDACTGAIYDLSGAGLTLQNCGTESPKAQYIFKTRLSLNNLKINDFFMFRQLGDAENSLAVSDCRVFYLGGDGFISVDGLSILETAYVGADNNSYVFEVAGNEVTKVCTSLKDFYYYKNYDGIDNPRMTLWKNTPQVRMNQRLSNPAMEFDYWVTSDKKVYPLLGGYHPTDSNYGSVNSDDLIEGKTIRLDAKSKFNTENNTSIQYTGKTNVGDLFLYNDPKNMNALGYTVSEKNGAFDWYSKQVPIVLSGATSARPTSNLYKGLAYFDETLNKPIWYNGSAWKDATGNTV